MVLGFGKHDNTTTTNPTGTTHSTTGGTHAVGSGPVSGTGYNNYPEVNASGRTGEGVSGHHVGGSGAHVAGQHLPGESERVVVHEVLFVTHFADHLDLLGVVV